MLEDSQVRVEKFGFGAHHWRWGIHVATCLAEVLLAKGQPDKALIQAEKALVKARETGSQKYLGKAYLLRGGIAAGAGDWTRAETDLREALSIAQRIRYPNLVWLTAHALARALASRIEKDPTTRSKGDEVHTLAALAAATIRSIAERAPDAALSSTFLGWSRVQAALEDLEQLQRF